MGKEAKARKAGRPVEQPSSKQRRIAVGLQLSTETKKALIRIAKEQGIGFSRAAEMAIERAFLVDGILKKQGTSLEKLDLDKTRAELTAKGWPHSWDGASRVWHEPDPSLGPQFGFIKGEDQ
jgi:hypothetical protein